MKKTLLLAFSMVLVLALVFGLSGCNKDKGNDENEVTYTLDSTDFVGVVEYEGTLDTAGLYLVPSEGDRIPVTADMLGGVDTLSVGEKEHTFTYEEQTFTVNYVVKFLVTYIINGVESKQLVFDSDEVVVPDAPDVLGKQFEGWSRELPDHLTSNVVIEAIYQTLSSAQDEIFTWLGKGAIDLTGYAPEGADFEVLVLDEFEDEDDSLADVTLDESTAKINYSLNSDDPVIISFKAYDGDSLVAEKSWYIEKVAKPNLTISDNSGIVGITVGDRNAMQRVNNNSDITFKYRMTYSNGNVEINEGGDMLYITPIKAGVTNVTIKAVNSMNALESIDLQYCVVVKPSVFDITELAHEYGIENIWTIGGFNADTLPALNLSYANAGEGFLENITWVTDDADVTVNNGTISFATTDKATELVNVVARFSYGGITLDSQPMTIRCVFGGVNVFNYEDLYNETLKTDPRPIVLQNSIKDDFSSTNYVEMHTTFEDTYYANANILEQAKVKVLLQFRGDVYGNGYEINAHNATLGTHGDMPGTLTDRSIFRGPLNLVAFSQSADTGAISAKAQDNICFAVYEGVTLNNLVLKSCDLTPDPNTNQIDLTDLDYAGTTVEVLGDNVTLEYSRITNGRNIVRAFGDETDETKVINVYIKNCILGYSREFILRIGSNRFVDCTMTGPELEELLDSNFANGIHDLSPASPLLPGDDGDDYKIGKVLGAYGQLSASEKAAYDEKYIMTFVTVENTVFEEAGIFAIGLETHFAGNYLQAGSMFGDKFGGFDHWHDLAKTSYGAKLTFEGDVRLYNWKPLDAIDSSILMENKLTGVLGDAFAGKGFDPMELNFSVTEMVDYVSGQPGFANILDEINGKKYVHNGIVVYGGGKNYSVFENNIDSVSFNHAFQYYPVSFSDVKQDLLTLAAGGEEFSFFIYDRNGTFTYNDQINLKNKYDCVYN